MGHLSTHHSRNDRMGDREDHSAQQDHTIGDIWEKDPIAIQSFTLLTGKTGVTLRIIPYQT